VATELTAARPGRAEAPGEEAFSFTLLSGRDAPAAARHTVAAETDPWHDGELAGFSLALLVSELVTNAVAHGSAGPEATVLVEGSLIGSCLGIEVTNHGPAFDHAGDLPPDSELGGRGLALVDALATRWGAVHSGGYTTVWFELDAGGPRDV
jgi:hypothetical protein